jgi:hypothetical protein
LVSDEAGRRGRLARAAAIFPLQRALPSPEKPVRICEVRVREKRGPLGFLERFADGCE